jgi:hypothetical protein
MDWPKATVLKLDTNPFPYQELTQTVLVWHTTCNRREQPPAKGQKWEGRD